MGKNLKDMTRQEQAAYFKSKDYCGEELKIVMDAINYGIGADYLQLFEDTTIPVEIMENMFTAMKEDYGVEEAAFLSAVRQEEAGRILLEAMKSGIPLTELQQIYQVGMLPIELREKILPLMQVREPVSEKIGEKVEFITEAVRELKESFLMQNSFIEELRKTMEEKPDILSAQEKGAEEDTDTADDPYYLELEAENKNLHEQLLIQQSFVAGLQEKQAVWESSPNIQEYRRMQDSQRSGIGDIQQDKISQQRKAGAMTAEAGKQSNRFPSFSFPFARKKPELLNKLAGELDAGQIAELRLGIEDGLSEGQLILLADKTMDAEKIRELRMTMKILNERGQGT